METTVILRSLLLHAKKSETIEEMELAIEALCTKEDIEVVNQTYLRTQKSKEKQNSKK